MIVIHRANKNMKNQNKINSGGKIKGPTFKIRNQELQIKCLLQRLNYYFPSQ